MLLLASLPSLPSGGDISFHAHLHRGYLIAHQSLHGAMKSMPMVSSKFRVGAFERRIAMGFRLLDARREKKLKPSQEALQVSVVGNDKR